MKTSPPTPEQFLGAYPAQVQQLANQLRQLVRQTAPNTVEAVYPGWRLIGYRLVDGRQSHYFCYVAPHADRVQLGFEHGINLTNTAGLLEGAGSQVRYVTIRRETDIQPDQLAALIAEAAMVTAMLRRRV